MHAIKMTLVLALSVMSSQAWATLVPMSNEVLEANLKSESGSRYVDGYVQLNKADNTISILLQPVMPPCAIGNVCTEAMPAPFQFFLDEAQVTLDACDAVIYEAEGQQENLIKVTVVDNRHYNYERCPTFLPVPETVVQVEETFASPSSAEPKREYFAGTVLNTVRY